VIIKTCPFHPYDIPELSEVPATDEQKRWWGVDAVWIISCKWQGCFMSRTSGSVDKEKLVELWNNRNSGFHEVLRILE